MLETRYHPATWVLIACVLWTFADNCQAGPIQVRHPMQAGNIAWISAYDLELESHQISVDIRLSLLTPREIGKAMFERRVENWRQAIESKWNQRFYAAVGEQKLPIRFNFELTHHRPHHRIVIHPGLGVPNQHNWYMDTPAAVIAHEIGHMLGAFDEYRRGAISPDTGLIDSSSIMGDNPDAGVAYPRHLSLLRQDLKDLLDDDDINIVAY